MKPMELIGLATGDPKFVKVWNSICVERQQLLDEWIHFLRINGISAAHPDDGWVDRKGNKAQFVYPYFNDGIENGAIVALGKPDKYRLVKLINSTPFPLFSADCNSYWWDFVEIDTEQFLQRT